MTLQHKPFFKYYQLFFNVVRGGCLQIGENELEYGASVVATDLISPCNI